MRTPRAIWCSLVAISAIALPSVLPARPEAEVPTEAATPTCVFDGLTYFHRWSEKDQHEFTPGGQEDLARWSDMITVVLNPSIADENGLASLANGLLGNYRQARAVIVRTNSKPRTGDQLAEHLVVAIFPQPNRIEVAFARVKLVDGVGCILVYSHRDYGEKIGNQVSAWLKAKGPDLEKTLMTWDGFPHPAALTSEHVKTTAK